MFCPRCGKELDNEAVICIHCGCAVNQNALRLLKHINADGKDWLATMLLAWFTGCFGIHRFYTGYIGIGIVQLLTCGGCGIWAFIDWIYICFNKFKDSENKPLANYKPELALILFIIGIVLSIVGILLFGFIGFCSGIKD